MYVHVYAISIHISKFLDDFLNILLSALHILSVQVSLLLFYTKSAHKMPQNLGFFSCKQSHKSYHNPTIIFANIKLATIRYVVSKYVSDCKYTY